MKHATFPQPGERSAEECLFWWGTVCKVAKPGFEQDFASSIAAQSRRRNWRPSPKQLATMRRMVADLFRAMRDDGDDDLPLIEH